MPEQVMDRGRGRRGKNTPFRLAAQDRGKNIRCVTPRESSAAAQHLEKNCAESPDIGAFIHGLASRLLGTHVCRRPEYQTVGGFGSGQRRTIRTILISTGATFDFSETEVQ